MQMDFNFQSVPSKPKKKEDLGVSAPSAPLTPSQSAPQPLTVSALTQKIRILLEGSFPQVQVCGEVSNYRCQASGHHYFTIKDAQSQLSCVWFKNAALRQRGVQIQQGQSVILVGQIAVYEARGQYQLIVEHVQKEGQGALHAQFETLKARLQAEGCFAPERKRLKPAFPRRIGVITSPTGAALRDFLKILHQRMPSIEVIVYPVRVQGRGACLEIAQALRDLGSCRLQSLFSCPLDAIVLTRGGGSYEDLWEFNEEVVARAIMDSRIFVLSAIGHEIDFTIADFVADQRAPTPSAAAEYLAADIHQLQAHIQQQLSRLSRECQHGYHWYITRLKGVLQSALFRDAQRVLRQKQQFLDERYHALCRATQQPLQRKKMLLDHSDAVLKARQPQVILNTYSIRLKSLEQRMMQIPQERLKLAKDRVDAGVDLLKAYSPQATLLRGYSLTFSQAGTLIRAADELHVGEHLMTRFSDGEICSKVIKPA